MRTLIVEFQPFFVGETYESYNRVRSGSPGKHYHYAYVGKKDVKRGDWALVHNGTNFGIVEIKRIVPGIQPNVTKHVIEVLTQDEFEAYKRRNESIDEMRAMMDELKYRAKQEKELGQFEDLASRDPEAKRMLDRLRGFFGMSSAPAIDSTSSASAADTEGSEARERTEACD